MIAFAPGDRVLVEDEHALWTGRVVDLFALVRPDRDDVGYVISLDGSGLALLALGTALWPEAGPIPLDETGAADVEDGCHEWIKP